MDKYLILGSGSFAGSSFINYVLDEKTRVVGINRSAKNPNVLPYSNNRYLKNFNFYELDINLNLKQILSVIDKFKPDYIIDFAGQGMVAESWIQPEEWYQTNIVSKIQIYNYVKNLDYLKKYIRISTPEVYGSCKNLIKEDAIINPSTPYAVSHAASDMSLKIYFKEYQLPMIIGRFANFYGPYQQLFRIIPKTIISILLKKRLPLHGSGQSIRSFLYMDDMSSAIIKMLKAGKSGEIYHFSSDNFISIRDLVKTITDMMGVKFEESVTITNERASKDYAYLMDSSKANQLLGWQSEVKLEDGISKTYDWINDNFNDIKDLRLTYHHKK